MTAQVPPEAGTVTRRFTRRGGALLVVGLLAVVTAFAARERELLVVAGLCLSVPLLSALWVSLRRNRVTGEARARPPAVDSGAPGDLLLTLSSTSSLPTPVVRVVCPRLAESSPIELLAGDLVVPPLRRGTPQVVEVPFHGRRRGRALVPSPVVRFADPFGLWQEDHTPAQPAELLVLPSVVPLEGLPTGLDRRRAGRPADIGGEPDVVVRPYVPGDDIRTIHWRASARLEEDLVVRLREAGSARSVALVLDDRPRAHTGDGLEVAVALAASAGMRVRRAGLPLSVSDAAGQVLLDGEEDPERLLHALAYVGEGGTRARAFTPEVPGRPELVIAVLGSGTHGGDVAWLRQLAQGVPGLAFSVGGPPRGLPAGWQSVVVESLAQRADGAPAWSPDDLTRVVKQAWRAATGAAPAAAAAAVSGLSGSSIAAARGRS